MQNPMCGFIDKIPVMGYIEQGTFIMVQGCFQYFSGKDIQMVGGLIQNQKVALRKHQFG